MTPQNILRAPWEVALWGASSVSSPLEQFELLGGGLSAAVFGWEYALGALPSVTQILLGYLPLLLLLAAASAQLGGLTPRGWLGWLLELALEATRGLLHSGAGLAHQGYLPLLLEFGTLLVIFNLAGLLPYGFTLTAQLVVTFLFGWTFFFGLNFIALRRHGQRYWGLFLPAGTPFALAFLLVLLELVSYFSRVISISVRLFANMMAGHALLKILASFTFKALSLGGFSALLSLLGLQVVFAILGLEFGVALLQCFVFLTLLSLYIADVAHGSH